MDEICFYYQTDDDDEEEDDDVDDVFMYRWAGSNEIVPQPSAAATALGRYLLY